MTPVVSRTELEHFRAFVVRRFGLQYDDGRVDYLADILRRRMEATGSPGFDEYLAALTSSPKRLAELRALAEQLTVAETFFFRNGDSFRAFSERVLPECVRSTPEKQLRILSAGCASGEEPYSLAILLREGIPNLESWDVKITGIDVNPAVLLKAAQARYSPWSLRATSEGTQRRWFRPDGRDFVLDPAVQKMVAFEERNLVDEDPLFWESPRYDVVFCRNVLMYFAPDVMQEVVHRLRQVLLPGGFLFLGHAETLRGLSQDFHLCHTHDTFYYRRREGSEASSQSPTAWEARPNPPANPFHPVVETMTSWVDVIQQASQRIALLTNDRSPPDVDAQFAAVAAAVPVASSWDLVGVHDAMRHERFSDALELLSVLPQDAHSAPDALLLRAALLTNIGRLEEAEAACIRVLAVDELNAGAHYLMALCREHVGDSSGSLEHDLAAVYLEPGFAMPHLHLGLAARRSGDPTTARRELGQAVILLASEDALRLSLFGGGLSRETLLRLCRAELRAVGGGR